LTRLVIDCGRNYFIIVAVIEEHRVRVSENGVLRRIFGPKREEDG
jgi:hypothetical protein